MLTLYYGSGSPYAWRVNLALEHKALPYERRVLSFGQGDLKKPEFVALNPRGKVPVLTDGDFALYESSAIMEYLDEAYPGRGQPLFPGDAKRRAVQRRVILEMNDYFEKAAEALWVQAFEKKPDERDMAALATGREAGRSELDRIADEHGVLVVGSQSILGPIPNAPPELKMSAEADMYPLNARAKPFRSRAH